MVERYNWHRREREREKRRDEFERSRRRFDEQIASRRHRETRDYIQRLEEKLKKLQSANDKTEMREEVGRVMKTSRKLERRQKLRAAAVGAAGAGAAYGFSPLPGYLRDGVNTLISTSTAAKNVYDALMELVSGGGTKKDIIKFFDANREYSDQLGEDIKQYEESLRSRRDSLTALKRAYENVGRILTDFPGVDSAPVKEIVDLRGRIVAVISGVLRGDREKQEIRRSKEYEEQYTDALKIVEKAEQGKKITNQEVRVLIKKLEEPTEADIKYTDETIEALRGLAKTYNEYQSVSKRFEGLSPRQIRDRDESYQKVIEMADKYRDIKGSDYTGEVGDVAAVSAGLVLAAAGAYAGGKVRDLIGYRPNTKKIEKILAKQDRKKARKEGLEGKVGIFLIGIFALYFLMIANKVTGYSLLSDFSKSQDVGIIALFAIIAVYGIFFIFRKIYKK